MSVKMHSTESRFVIGPSNVLFAGVYVYTSQPGNFAGCCSEGVKSSSIPPVSIEKTHGGHIVNKWLIYVTVQRRGLELSAEPSIDYYEHSLPFSQTLAVTWGTCRHDDFIPVPVHSHVGVVCVKEPLAAILSLSQLAVPFSSVLLVQVQKVAEKIGGVDVQLKITQLVMQSLNFCLTFTDTYNYMKVTCMFI